MKNTAMKRKRKKRRRIYKEKRISLKKLMLKRTLIRVTAAMLICTAIVFSIKAYFEEKAYNQFKYSMNILQSQMYDYLLDSELDDIQKKNHIERYVVGMTEGVGYIHFMEDDYGVFKEGAAAVYSIEDGGVIADYSPSAAISLSDMIYTCDMQSNGLDRLYDQYISYRQQYSGDDWVSFYARVNEIYISPDNGTFIPIKGGLYYDPQEEVGWDKGPEYVADIDFTPDSTEGYHHMKLSENVWMQVSGTKQSDKSTETVDQLIENALIDYEENVIARNDTEDRTTDGGGKYPDGSICFNFTSRLSSNGKIYYFCVAEVFDFYAGASMLIWKIYMIGFVIAAASAVISSYLTHSKNTARWAMEDYRREMTNTMAHDLKSPLMAISGYAENLIENIHTEKREHYANAIMENAEYMNRIIMQVLELGELENGHAVSNKKDIPIMSMTAEQLKKYELEIDKKQIEIIQNGELNVKADAEQLERAIDNLISNAVKYTPINGTIEIYVSNNAFSIINSSDELTDRSPEELMKPFVKGDSSRSDKKGSGIGLAIVKNIADLHGWDIEINITDGSFEVKLIF